MAQSYIIQQWSTSFTDLSIGNNTIEIIEIECGLLSRVSQKLSPQNGGFIMAKLVGPRTFCAKANGNFWRKSKMADL